ncbi:MAG: alkaline phosphatase family protein [Myxococcota bacterium]
MRIVTFIIALLVAANARAEGPVVVLGLDAATYDVIDPLVERGELPNLAKLMARGSRAVLESERPIRSPALWTTLATGQPRSVHGIYDFVTGSNYWPKEKRSETSRLVTSDMRRSKAIWQYASEAGREVLVVGWLNSWPAEKVNGVMVAPFVALGQYKQTSIKGKIYKDARDQTYPRELFHQLEPLVVSPDDISAAQVRQIVRPPPPGSKLYEDIPKLERYLYTVRWSLASALTNFALIEEQLKNQSLVMTFFDGSDTLAHRFWLFRETLSNIERRLERHGMPASRALELKARFGEAVENYYRFIDARLGVLIDKLPPESTVVVISDHGFGTYDKARAIHSSTPFDGMHTLDGVLIAAGPGIKRGSQVKRLNHYDVVPTLMYRLGLAIPSELPGRPATELFETSFNEGRSSIVSRDTTRRNTEDDKTDIPFEDAEIERLRSLGYVK